MFHCLFLSICDKHAPIKTCRVRGSAAPWINDEVRHLIYQRDTVDHHLLLKKLSSIGINSTELHWFESYLANRSQVVNFKGSLSDQGYVEYGVPQGSILGPLLFIIYINDITNVIEHCKVVLYTDDTAIFFSDKLLSNVQKYLQIDMSNVSTWLRQNKLTLNVTKTKCMLI